MIELIRQLEARQGSAVEEVLELAPDAGAEADVELLEEIEEQL